MKEKELISLNKQSEETQLEVVRIDGSYIQYIKNPSEQVQLEAVMEYRKAIQYIKNPTEQVQLFTVKYDGCVIQYIKNPSERVQLEAVREDGHAIKYIENPSEEVQLEAIRHDGRYMYYIDNPSDYIKSVLDVIETTYRTIYVLHEPNKKPLFSIGCQCNITKEYFINRIYSMDGGLKENPHRQEYLDIINRY